ncbi:fungal-specific transcription factor domain-containing protein [Aspergillus unguis]
MVHSIIVLYQLSTFENPSWDLTTVRRTVDVLSILGNVVQNMSEVAAAAGLEGAPSPRTKKRSQVSRACNWCRARRMKCDNGFPCANCQKRGGECNNDRLNRAASLPEANQEVEILKRRVEELELELERERRRPVHPGTPVISYDSPDSAIDLSTDSRNKAWEGIFISTARAPNKTWYGSSSLFFFIGSINNFLATALKHNYSARGMLPASSSTVLYGPTATIDGKGGREAGQGDDICGGESLSSMQEEYFLNLFWESYYPTYPVLDENEFKEHYQSLWADSGPERKPSALVDIVIAVCMQYGMARQPRGRHSLNAAARGNVDESDATIAGRWHYRRCLTLLATELESPTLSTLQCHLLCSIYLCYAGFQNTSDKACALAIRTAFMLGLHVEPPKSMPRRERELRKRVWWTLYVLDSNRSIKLGRPFTLQTSASSCALPADDREIAALSGSSFAPIGGNVTWLTWSLHKTKLILSARKAYATFYSKSPDSITIHDTEQIKRTMDIWLHGVPEPLKTSRVPGGVPFSTDRSQVRIEQFTPAWLQRERLLLELMYHNLCLVLYRFSICFTLNGSPTAIDEPTALKCAAHAMAATHIMHQVLETTSILNGWHEAFQWQWNAAMTLVGFLLAFPQSSSACDARNTIDLSVTALEHFGNGFPVAANAATIMRDLSVKVDHLSNGKDVGISVQQLVSPGREELSQSSGYDPTLDWPVNWDASTEIGGILGHSIDISAETLTDVDWSNMNSFFDQWFV